MKKRSWATRIAGLLLSFAGMTATAADNATVVLVHGFLGWGRDEMLGLKHFGGFNDIQADLQAAGIPTVTPAMGPVSSNWDRAAELYAQLTGTCTDYGAAHAARHQHARYGRCYSRLVSQWDAAHPVHLIAHSQGAQTTRTLVQLLAEGSSEELGVSGNAASPLFQGGKRGWVKSITTLSGANNGTTLAMVVDDLLPYAQQVVGAAAALVGVYDGKVPYDLKLDQFGLKREQGESLSSYFSRVQQSSIWQQSQDNARYDLLPDGAQALNRWVKTQPDTYYFSYVNGSTVAGLITGHHYPILSTNALISPLALAMGAYSTVTDGGQTIDSRWWRNDGVVNTVSMAAPFGQPTATYVSGQAPRKGAWYTLGDMAGWDHLDTIGLLTDKPYSGVKNFYLQLATFVKNLP